MQLLDLGLRWGSAGSFEGGPSAPAGIHLTYTQQTRIFGGEVYFNIDYPPGIIVGDQLYLVLFADPTNGANTWITPAGWVLEGHDGSGTSDCTITLLSKIADGTETGTLQIDGGTAYDLVGFMVKSTNTLSGIPVYGVATATSNVTVASCASITTVNNQAVAFACGAFDGGDAGVWTVDNGFTMLAQAGVNDGAGVSGAVATKIIDTAGVTGLTQLTTDGATVDGTLGMQFCIYPS